MNGGVHVNHNGAIGCRNSLPSLLEYAFLHTFRSDSLSTCQCEC